MRRVLLIALVIAGVLALWLWQRRSGSEAGVAALRPAQTTPGGQTNAAPLSGLAADSAEEFPLAVQLNAPDSTVARDLDLLGQILDAWRTNFPREGNPVGENAEITAALTGNNRLQLALIPKKHRAINARGELCDRWGTPIRFHQLSGQHMELRSAGPDRKFGTPDDALWSPTGA